MPRNPGLSGAGCGNNQRQGCGEDHRGPSVDAAGATGKSKKEPAHTRHREEGTDEPGMRVERDNQKPGTKKEGPRVPHIPGPPGRPAPSPQKGQQDEFRMW